MRCSNVGSLDEKKSTLAPGGECRSQSIENQPGSCAVPRFDEGRLLMERYTMHLIHKYAVIF